MWIQDTSNLLLFHYLETKYSGPLLKVVKATEKIQIDKHILQFYRQFKS